MSSGAKVNRAANSPATSSTNLSDDPYILNLGSLSRNTNHVAPSLVDSCTESPSMRIDETLPPISSAGNAVVIDSVSSDSCQRFKMLRSSSGLRELWGSNFDSILDEHERINREVDALKKRTGV